MSNGIRVLVIDDDIVIRKSVTKLLSTEGYEVFPAESGKKGIEIISNTVIDIVILDVMMPDMDGYSTCQRIRKFKDVSTVPVIMLTGVEDADSVSKAFDAGATDFVTKPINWALLTQRVKYALRSRDTYLELKRNQSRLRQSQQLAKIGYWELNPVSMMLKFSEEMCAMLGHDDNNGEIDYQSFIDLVHPEEREVIDRFFHIAIVEKNGFQIDHRMVLADGKEIIVQSQAQIEENELQQSFCIIGVIQDITKRKEAEALIEYQHFYDQLTGLPNKNGFTQTLDNVIKRAKEKNIIHAVLFVGLDRFKLINESLGHSDGDLILKQIADRLATLVRDGFTVARFSGDVFAISTSELKNADEASGIARNIKEMIAQPVVLKENEYFLTSSTGITLFPIEENSSEALYRATETAMNNAKHSGGNRYLYYDATLNIKAARKLDIEKGLRKALDNNEFRLFYQPQVDVQTRKIVGLEALVRWDHPENGIISPLDFIPVAEECGLIIPIGEWVLEEACQQVRQWTNKYEPLSVGVNLSAKQFMQEGLSQKIKNIISRTGIAPQSLDLEITESIVLNDIQETIDILQDFRDIGVSTSMDDFGTGYSSLNYLHQLPIDTLKIDRAFIKGIGNNGPDNGGIARAIIAMAHSLGMSVIAEGVETEYQFNFLARYQCDEIQGFLYSPPVPAEKFEEMLKIPVNPFRKSVAG